MPTSAKFIRDVKIFINKGETSWQNFAQNAEKLASDEKLTLNLYQKQQAVYNFNTDMTFHPDDGNDSYTKYTQKINNTYEILKNAIGK